MIEIDHQKIILIEDNNLKANDIIEFLKENSAFDFDIVLKDSYRNGLKELFTNNYDLLLLDMSLPTRDEYQSSVNQGYEKFGGYAIMKELKRKNKELPVILITMFKEFGGGSNFLNLEELDNICKDEFADFYLDYVFYSSQEGNWKEKLTKIIKQLK